MSDQQLTNTLLRAEALMKSNWIHGLHLLETAVKEHPDDPRPYMGLAEFYIKRQLFKKAIKNLQTASKLAPKNDGIKYLLGNCYFATGDYRTAIVYYDMISAPSTDVQYNKALALAHQGNAKQSIVEIKNILTEMDNLPFLYFLLVEQLLRLSDIKQAKYYIRKAEQKVGKHGHLMFLKAVIYTQDQMWLQAYDAFYEADKIKPLIEGNHLFNFAMSAKRIGLENRAIELLYRALEAEPQAIAYYEEILKLLIKQKKYKDAVKSLELAQKHLRRFSPVLNLLKSRIEQEQP